MNLHEWSRSHKEYGRKLLDSGLEGARCGRNVFFHGEPSAPFLNQSARGALRSAAVGVCLGVLGSYPGNRNRSASKALTYAFLGGAIGFGAAVAWESRRLAACVAGGALKNIGRVRDEHWLQTHPIDYA